MPNIGQLAMTAGNGGDVISRINCNEFVENICTNHGFIYGKNQDIIRIRQTIPVQYQADFDNGLNL